MIHSLRTASLLEAANWKPACSSGLLRKRHHDMFRRLNVRTGPALGFKPAMAFGCVVSTADMAVGAHVLACTWNTHRTRAARNGRNHSSF